MMFQKLILLFVLLTIWHWSTCPSLASEDTHNHQHTPAEQNVLQPNPEATPGVTEKLGQIAAVDTVFTDEDGTLVTIQDLLNIATLVLPVYFNCPNVCDILQGNMTGILPKVQLQAGDEYQVLSVSFDPTDTPTLAKRRKNDFFNAMGNSFPSKGWRFLTGDDKNIAQFMASLGFQFQKQADSMYAHPVVAVAIAPGGKIVRYLYGDNFLPFDVTLAMTEANQGKTGVSLKRVLAYCFSYDPAGKRYVLNVTRIAGTAILSLLFVFVVALVLAGRKTRRENKT
jgi:protein SCO1